MTIYEEACKKHGIRIVECHGKGNEGLFDWTSKTDASENPFPSREAAAFDACVWGDFEY